MGDLVYGASCSGVLYALDRVSGEVRWKHDTEADGARAQFHGDPVVTDELLVIPSDATPAAFVYAFELATGEIRWKTMVAPQGITSHLVRYGDSVVGLSPYGQLVSFDLATGDERWSIEPEDEETVGLNAHPTLSGDRIYYGASDGHVRAVDAASGSVLWETDLGARPNTQVVVDGGHLVIGAVDGRLHRLDKAEGSITRQLELPGTPVGTPALTAESMVFVLDAGYLVRVDRSLESTTWSYSSPSKWSSFQPLRDGDVVVAGTDDGDLMAFDLENGAIAWHDVLEGTLRGIGEADGVYYVGSLQGNLYAYTRVASDGPAEPLPWLHGSWVGAKGESTIQETWSDRLGNDRMGMFRLVQGDQVGFYEFMTIDYGDPEGPVLRIKHFSAGLRGWEEPDESEVFYLVDSGPREAVFAQRESEVPTRLIYRLGEDGGLTILLEKDREGGTSTSEFSFDRRQR